MENNIIRPRVCAAIIKNDQILMVQHRHDGREYWTLPGGGIEAGETAVEAVIREVREETGLVATVARLLFEESYLNGASPCHCYLVDVADDQEAVLGADPEQEHLEQQARMLQGVAWHPLASMQQDRQVSKVLQCLSASGRAAS
jgi:8-oxo-dGTP diphosphatase